MARVLALTFILLIAIYPVVAGVCVWNGVYGF